MSIALRRFNGTDWDEYALPDNSGGGTATDPTALRWKGVYGTDVDDSTAFNTGDVVSLNGGLFVATTPGLGDSTTDPIADFELMAGPPLKGDKGDKGDTGPMGPAGAGAANAVTVDTAQTITGAKFFSDGSQLITSGTAALPGTRFGSRASLMSNDNVNGVTGTTWILDNLYYDGSQWHQTIDGDAGSYFTVSGAGGIAFAVAPTATAGATVVPASKFKVSAAGTITGYGTFNNSGNINGYVITGRNLVVNPTNATTINLQLNGYSAQSVASSILKMGAGQTGNALEVQTSAGAILSRIGPDGAIYDNGNRVYSAANPPPGGGGAAGTEGKELGYVERTTNDSTTNNVLSDATLAANTIPGLSITVVGTGTPVEIEMFDASASHSVAGGRVYMVLLVNGVQTNGTYGGMYSSTAGYNASIIGKRRMVLTNGVSYTFTIGKFISGTGTGTYSATATAPMYLSVVQR